jgi:hypothetical protein
MVRSVARASCCTSMATNSGLLLSDVSNWYILHIFSGSWLDDKASGMGRLEYCNGDSYDGQWERDHRHGVYLSDYISYQKVIFFQDGGSSCPTRRAVVTMDIGRRDWSLAREQWFCRMATHLLGSGNWDWSMDLWRTSLLTTHLGKMLSIDWTRQRLFGDIHLFCEVFWFEK